MEAVLRGGVMPPFSAVSTLFALTTDPARYLPPLPHPSPFATCLCTKDAHLEACAHSCAQGRNIEDVVDIIERIIVHDRS